MGELLSLYELAKNNVISFLKDLVAEGYKNVLLYGVVTAVENGIIVGSGGRFMPRKKANRAEATVVLYRLYELVIMD